MPYIYEKDETHDCKVINSFNLLNEKFQKYTNDEIEMAFIEPMGKDDSYISNAIFITSSYIYIYTGQRFDLRETFFDRLIRIDFSDFVVLKTFGPFAIIETKSRKPIKLLSSLTHYDPLGINKRKIALFNKIIADHVKNDTTKGIIYEIDGGKFIVSPEEKTIKYNQKTFNFSDIKSFELVIDDGLEKVMNPFEVLAGGFLYGLAGEINSATLEKKIKRVTLCLSVNDFYNPVYTINILNRPLLSSDEAFKIINESIRRIVANLNMIIEDNKSRN